MYGAQTEELYKESKELFENDVEMYGAQTSQGLFVLPTLFENDVEMYGAQTSGLDTFSTISV